MHQFHLIFICILYLQTLFQKIFITPRYAQNHATFISSVVRFNDTSIYFGPYSNGERLLEVPLISAGMFTRNESISIQITAVMNGGILNSGRDRDPFVGVTDGSTTNIFGIADITHYPTTPCGLSSGSGMLWKTSTGPVPDLFTFLLKPAERFGACSTAQQGGYVNVGIFDNQLDPSRGIKLQIKRNERDEDYRFYYFLVEIFQ